MENCSSTIQLASQSPRSFHRKSRKLCSMCMPCAPFTRAVFGMGDITRDGEKDLWHYLLPLQKRHWKPLADLSEYIHPLTIYGNSAQCAIKLLAKWTNIGDFCQQPLVTTEPDLRQWYHFWHGNFTAMGGGSYISIKQHVMSVMDISITCCTIVKIPGSGVADTACG